LPAVGNVLQVTRVLVIGYAPDAVDFTDPAVPPGLNEDLVADGIKRDVQLMRERGWEAEHLPIRADGSLRDDVLDRLARKSFDWIVIGAGVRMTTKHVAEFEQVIDAVRHGAPQTPIAFNSSPDSSGEAAVRWLG
jgi:pentose-5-phosphate-3-epimerase